MLISVLTNYGKKYSDVSDWTVRCFTDGTSREFMKTRLQKLICLHVKWTQYLCKDFKVHLDKLTGIHWKWTQTSYKIFASWKISWQPNLTLVKGRTYFNVEGCQWVHILSRCRVFTLHWSVDIRVVFIHSLFVLFWRFLGLMLFSIITYLRPYNSTDQMYTIQCFFLFSQTLKIHFCIFNW